MSKRKLLCWNVDSVWWHYFITNPLLLFFFNPFNFFPMVLWMHSALGPINQEGGTADHSKDFIPISIMLSPQKVTVILLELVLFFSSPLLSAYEIQYILVLLYKKREERSSLCPLLMGPIAAAWAVSKVCTPLSTRHVCFNVKNITSLLYYSCADVYYKIMHKNIYLWLAAVMWETWFVD